MPNHSRVILVGHLVKDPEFRHTPNGKELAKFRMAVNTGYGENKKTMFIDVTSWGKTAEAVSKYLQKGSCALVDGRLEQDDWTDKETGEMRYKHVVTATDVKFMDTKPKEDQPRRQTPPQRDMYEDDDPPF